MITVLKTNIQDFTHIIHIADVHLRLTKRHDEYREVFDKFYEEVKKSPDTSAIAILGDIFHSKSDLSPECVQLGSDFFKKCADLRPTIVIPGNHDTTLTNKNRLDSLTPIVDALNHPNLFYLKKSGLYGFGNILWNNMCVFDSPEQYILGRDIPTVYRNKYKYIIALFHGAVDMAALDSGYSISNPAIMTPLFDNHHMAMLGDIHKQQNMQELDVDLEKPCVHYVGSMIQQSHGESLKKHGYSLWDLSTKMYDFHELENDYGFFTVEVQKGLLVTNIDNIPKKTRLRVHSYDSITSELKSIVAHIKTITQVIEIAYVRMDQAQDKKNIIPLCKNIVLTDLTNVNYQNTLISDFLMRKNNIQDKKKIEDILDINIKNNGLITRDEFTRNLRWKPIRFEWSNMLNYGEYNILDFTKMDGVYGIFGPNRSGKSSILSALIFCLFDKFDRGNKGLHILNVQKTSFRCKLEFEISGIRYFIERSGVATRTGNVRVDVNFWRVVNGKEEELRGTERRDTNDIIRDYIGTYEDFILTAASFQNAKNLSSFIDMGHSERKDLMVQFIGLNIFDRLQDCANIRNKELNILLKIHKDKNYMVDIAQCESELSNNLLLLNKCNTELEDLKNQINSINDEIVNETSKLVKLDSNVPTNIKLLEDRKKTSEETINNKRQTIVKFKQLLVSSDSLLIEINKEIDSLEKLNLIESHKKYNTLSQKIVELKQKIDLKKVEIKLKLEKVSRLNNHKYDPNCKFCIDNSFVKDATNAKHELSNDKIESDAILIQLKSLEIDFENYKWVEKSYETYTKLLTKRSEIKDNCSQHNKNIIVATNELERLDAFYKTILTQIDLYFINVMGVDLNIKTTAKITSHKQTLEKLNIEYKSKTKNMVEVSGKVELLKNKIDNLKQTLAQMIALEYESECYQQYLDAVGRDGIPYQVICNTVPEIEKEVNAILGQVVDYTIQFDTDGKNIMPYVMYDHGRWPIEITSGYERFAASIAIRVALTNISNLPKCSFLAIDEGFGTLDSENLPSMSALFSTLKSNYDFIWVISHIDSLKDIVDKRIEIAHDGNFAKVVVI